MRYRRGGRRSFRRVSRRGKARRFGRRRPVGRLRIGHRM